MVAAWGRGTDIGGNGSYITVGREPPWPTSHFLPCLQYPPHVRSHSLSIARIFTLSRGLSFSQDPGTHEMQVSDHLRGLSTTQKPLASASSPCQELQSTRPKTSQCPALRAPTPKRNRTMPPRHALGELLRQLESDVKKPRAAHRLEQQLRALLAALDHSQREHDRLRNRMSYLHSCLELLDKEQAQQLLQLQQRMGLHGSLGKQVPMLPDDSPLRTAPGLAEGGAVSVYALPVPGRWDSAWDERVRALTPRDMFLLYKQYTQATAVMLPRAERAGLGSADYSSLQQLMDKYVAFAQHAISLAPGAWAHQDGLQLRDAGAGAGV